ncbi:sulfurtransferase [Undibacterium fentianense]|uniref:Sulfurtransferase n=1 Tax=Undibacterium fentianense TaxID=2828728 RepID=A0A941E5D0_9BURK|nr:sulfurtransferase [Undibacterium fentianense]MBR7800924.1 sulfurtransferase [Undibacterium fentianense]
MYTTLISAQQLAVELKNPSTVVVDCRHDLMDAQAGKNAYDTGHIPGAVFANLDIDLSGSKLDAAGVFAGRHPLPKTEDLLAALRSLGINQDSQVIAYDAHGGMFAARLWWLLRSIGHAQVAVLDGGIAAWIGAGHAVQTESVSLEAGNIQAKESLTKQVNVQTVLQNLQASADAQLQVIDARAPDRFRGENETMDPVGGHIPGAKNRFFKDNLQADGRFKSAQELRDEWQGLIADPSKAIMQCGSGVTACHNLLALEVAGLGGAALYPGSWSEWCADASRPVASGAA